MTDITTVNRVCEHLEKYVFDKIWNDPYSEYRTFIVPESLNTVVTTGIFFGRYSQIQLPSDKVSYSTQKSSFFYVFAVPALYFRSLRFGVLEWTRLDEFCTDNLIDVEFFSSTGRRCTRSGVFLRQADKNDCILVAIEQNAFRLCFGNEAKPTDRFYFGKYFDSDLHPSVKYECFRLDAKECPINQPTGKKYDPITRTGVPTYTLYNGRLLTGDYMNVLGAGAFVEKVYDENIIGIVKTDPDPVTGTVYESDGEGRRILVHLPKEANPNHLVITPNTCDIYLVPTEMTEKNSHPQVMSVYLYQCGREEHFHQLTHNDFSIDYEWLNDLAASFGFTKYYIRVHVRVGDKSKQAIRDANYLNILYLHTDKEIIDFLLGRADFEMSFWTAKHLEGGLYAQALLKRRGVNKTRKIEDQCSECKVADLCKVKPNTSTFCTTYSRRSLKDYIDIIGYYHTLALIGKRVTYFEVIRDRLSPLKRRDPETGKWIEITENEEGVNEFTVRAPLALCDLTIRDFFPIVYHNGLRVDQSKIELQPGGTSKDLDDKYHRELVFTPDASWWTKVIDVNYASRFRVIVKDTEFKIGDKVVVELYDNRHNGSIRKIRFEKSNWVYSLTEDTVFKANKRYYVLYSGEDGYKLVDLPKSLIGKPIGPEYDIGIRDRDKNPILFKDFYEMFPQCLIPMVTTDEWSVWRINEEADGVNYTYHKIPDPGLFDETTMKLDLDPKWAGYDLAIVEGPLTLENKAEFGIDQYSIDYLGKELWPTAASIMEDFGKTNNFPLENELVFLNAHRCIRSLDYTMEGYNAADFHSGAKLYLQNVSYLKKASNYQVVRTNQSTLSNQRGFIRGNIIQWNHQNPFWFDELSILTIGGKVCSNIVHEFGTITITDPQEHDNGLPFEFRMSVSSKVKNLVGTYGEQTDRNKIERIKAYFDSKYTKPDFITMVKKAYKIYSLYLEAIISDYVRPGSTFDFVLIPNQEEFEAQFVNYTDWKRRDLAYNMSAEDLKYVDIYPIFNRLESINRYQFHKISELARRLLPTDQYKHKDAANVK